MKAEKPQLTISLLISNRLDTIPKCLDSLKPIMDTIPCELILTDTSKNPEVRNLLLKYTNQIYEFDWCNDFAKARNLGLEKANGEWFLYLDDDEWFVDTEPLIDFFKSGEYKKYAYAYYVQRNFKDAEYVYYHDDWVMRMMRIDDDTCFINKIHERLDPMRGIGKNINAKAYHSGYIYKTPGERRRHFERNCSLIKEMIKKEPNNMYWLLQLTQEYSYVGEHEKLVEHCLDCLKRIAYIDDVYTNRQRGAFYTGVVTGYLRLHQYEKCVEYAEKAIRDERTGDVLAAMMHLRLAECSLALGLNTKAMEEVQTYLEMLRIVDVSDVIIADELTVFLVGEAFSQNSQEIAYAILICSELREGKADALVGHYIKLGWAKPAVYTMEGIEKYFIDAMFTMTYHSIFTIVMLDVLDKANLREAFCKEILSRAEIEEDSFGELIYMIAYSMQEIQAGPRDNNRLEYVECLQNYVQIICQWCDFVETQEGVQFEEVPGYLQAAICISDYLELESKDTIQALGKLKEAVIALPDFAEGIGAFINNYSELENQRAQKQREEMEELRVQVIAQVREMLAAGQEEAAIQIVGQLKQMFPEDLEVKQLVSGIRINS